MKKEISATKFREILAHQDDDDLLRIWYCYELGSTFVIYNSLEDTLIGTMLMCDKVAVATRLGQDAEAWEKLLDKQQNLQSQTFGNLIKVLSRHIDHNDLSYLKFIKEKRDFFIHRFFRRGEWPGDLHDEDLVYLIRRLLFFQQIFMRASDRIPSIFGRSGLLLVQDLGENGFLLFNQNLFDQEAEDEPAD
jgi:hypothetical protein